MERNTRKSYLGPFVLAVVIVLAIVFAFRYWRDTHSAAPVSTTATAPQSAITCAQAGTSGPDNVNPPTALDASCAQLPYAPMLFQQAEGRKKLSNQDATDMYSWLSFVALNWPHQAGACTADAGSNISRDPNHPTWMTWIRTDSVFKASGPPDPWCGGGEALLQADQAALERRVASLPMRVQALAKAHPEVTLYLAHTAKSEEILHSQQMLGAETPSDLQAILQSTDLPIVDQNGRFARFSISMNQDQYNYIRDNALYTRQGQQSHTINWPVSDSTNHVMGTVELKAAWKVLGANDDPSHFFTQQAIVYNDKDGNPSPGPNPVTVGLVGLHIVHKSEGQNFWAWSTFEQTENLTKNFYNPNCVATSQVHNNHCIPNKPTADAEAKELDDNGKPLQFPTQIVKKDYIEQTNLEHMTQPFQKLLAGTPWQYYELISTQWAGGAQGAFPHYLGSPSQETFVNQNQANGQPLDSCIDCHHFSKTAAGTPAEFSFILRNAKQ